ncbi:unnamed protein product [Candidula unifasciata]|uniref:Cytochrome P450 n=1 Tax=Candidula unifasciata TaxID=100452 RepID=A0A8S3ZLY5_9EUPU|nr:unnamed protein product [Candidula unifasciata]
MEFLLLIASIILTGLYLWLRRPDPNLPPFPKRPLPLVGNLFHLADDSRPLFKRWRKQFGDIFSLNMGGTLVVVLNGFDVMKEAFVKKADAFSDRTPVFFDAATGIPEKGVAFSSGPEWKEQRSVALTILRKFGMGKNILVDKIQDVVSAYVDYLASQKGQPTDIRTMTNISTCNVICAIIIGHKFEFNDKEFQKLIAHLNSTALDQKNVSLINYISWLKYLPGDLFFAKKITLNVQVVLSLLKKFVAANRRTVVDFNDAGNFIEAYLAERNKKVQAGVSTYMDDENLLKTIHELFGAGTETTSTTIIWCVLYMINYPEMQEKVYAEIMEEVGSSRLPNMQDKTKLPYLNAVIMETQRLASIVPLSLLHLCSENVTLKGYTIPKGTWIIPNLDSVLHDKAIWGKDAMSFKPERFLDSTGKVQDREELIPFGIGRRVCLGEALANMELFLFLSNMFQRFQFLPKDKTPPSCNVYRFGLTCAPYPFEVRILPRKQQE